MAVAKKGVPAGSSKAAKKIIDFSNVKDRGQFNPKNVEAGDYLAKITKVEQTEARDGEDMWVFTFECPEIPRGTYPYYCKLVDNQYWKIKSLFTAAGTDVGQRKVSVDPNKLVGHMIGISLEDDEYEGRLKSVVAEVFSADEVESPEGDVEPEDDDLEEDEVEEEKPKRRAKKKPEPEPEEDDEEEEDEEEEPPAPKKRAAKKAPARKKAAPVEDDEDEEDDELEIDEL